MAIKDIFSFSRKTFFNPRAWFGYDTVAQSTSATWAFFKNVFFPAPVLGGEAETFQEAVTRLNLTEDDLQQAEKNFLVFAITFLILGIFIFCLSVFLLFRGHFLDFLIGLGVTALVVSQAFKYHFWHFQIKHRTLGVTFQEWKSGKINSRGETP